jgi:hypothetical protein
MLVQISTSPFHLGFQNCSYLLWIERFVCNYRIRDGKSIAAAADAIVVIFYGFVDRCLCLFVEFRRLRPPQRRHRHRPHSSKAFVERSNSVLDLRVLGSFAFCMSPHKCQSEYRITGSSFSLMGVNGLHTSWRR